ncbi:MAG: class I SAM-dependent methyltransferase [Bacteroidota bacterium]
MEQFSLQERGAKKCSLPAEALYTGPALEMSSSSAAARLHASLLPRSGRILEIAAGIGADSIALAEAAALLVSIEADPLHAHMLRHNLSLSKKQNSIVLHGRAEDLLPAVRLERFDAIFADPARRSSAKRAGRTKQASANRRAEERTHRSIDVQDYSPPFSFFNALPSGLPILIKIAPGADVPDGWGVATVAFGGECKEQLLHRNLGLPQLCAIDAETGERWVPGQPEPGPVAVGHPSWLIEPHGAIIRTGAVAAYCREQGCEPLDPMIAYGWTDTEPPRSRWHQRFRILRIENFNRKGLQRAVSEFGFGSCTEIKKRGFPDTPEEIRARLRFAGSMDGVIIITRRGEGHLMIFAERPAVFGG